MAVPDPQVLYKLYGWEIKRYLQMATFFSLLLLSGHYVVCSATTLWNCLADRYQWDDGYLA